MHRRGLRDDEWEGVSGQCWMPIALSFWAQLRRAYIIVASRSWTLPREEGECRSPRLFLGLKIDDMYLA